MAVTLNLTDEEAEELSKVLYGAAEGERHDFDDDERADLLEGIAAKINRSRNR